MSASAVETRPAEPGLAEKTQTVLNIVSLVICAAEAVWLVDYLGGNKLSTRAKTELERYRARRRAERQFRIDAAYVVLEAMLIVEPAHG